MVNEFLIKNLEIVQYQASAIQGMLCEGLYKEPGLESLQSRRLYRKIILFYKILNGLTPKSLFDIIPVLNDSCYNTRAQSKSEPT